MFLIIIIIWRLIIHLTHSLTPVCRCSVLIFPAKKKLNERNKKKKKPWMSTGIKICGQHKIVIIIIIIYNNLNLDLILCTHDY